MSVWQQKDWQLNHKTLNEIFPIIQFELLKYINKDIITKILSIIYYNDVFNSPIRPKRPHLVIPKAPRRPTTVRRLLTLP